MPKLGDKLDVWFPGGVIISLEPYRGRYKEHFTYVAKVTAPRTHQGWMEICL